MSIKDLALRTYIACKERNANRSFHLDGVVVERNVKYGERKGQVFSIYRPEKRKLPTVVYFHGGALVGRGKFFRRSFIADIARMGLTVLNVEYKGEVVLGAKECLNRAEDLLRFLKDNADSLKIDLDKLFFMGDELGAYVASHLALKAPNYDMRARGCVFLSGFYDPLAHAKGTSYYSTQYHFIKRFFGVDLKTARGDSTLVPKLREMSITRTLSEDYPPCLVVYSLRDEFIPEQGDALREALKAKEVSCWTYKVVYEKAYHNFHLNRNSPLSTSVMEYVNTFIKEALGGGIYRNEHREV